MGSDGHEKKQEHLKPQDASTVDASKLTALTPEVVGATLSIVQKLGCVSRTGPRLALP